MKHLPILVLFFLVCLSQTVQSQDIQIRGTLVDSAGTAVPGALVSLTSPKHKLAGSSDGEGAFLFTGIQDTLVQITIRSIGYDSLARSFAIDQRQLDHNLGTFVLSPSSNMLGEVVVEGVQPVILKEDTVQYDARAYRVREGDAVEEMVKKLPGMDVDKDGNITVNGEPITSIRLDGKDYFGNDVAAAVQNLPADIVQNLQVIDDYGEQANITGLKSGEAKKVLNINLRPDKKRGYFARTSAGAGTENRYTGRLRGNYLNGEQQFSADINANNTRSRSNGVNDNKSIKFNYRDNWGEHLESYGTYNFQANDNHSIQQTNSQNFFPDYTRYEDTRRNSEQDTRANRLSWNLEYRPDTVNYVKIQPNISFDKGSGRQSEESDVTLLDALSARRNQQRSSDRSSDLGLRVFFNHKFQKPRRNLTIDMSLGSGSGTSDNHTDNNYVDTDADGKVTERPQLQRSANDNGNFNMQASGSYLEPINKISYLEATYRWSRSSNDVLKETMDIDPDNGAESINHNLSNNYDYHFTTHRVGVNYRLKTDKINASAGLAAQPTSLSGVDISRDLRTSQQNFNWTPAMRFSYKLSREKQITVDYDGNNNQPNFRQLQPVTDNSNLQNVVTGNPNLKPEFVQGSGLEYKQTKVTTGSSLYARLNFQQVQDKIVTSKQIADDGIGQQTSYENINGVYSAGANYAITVPFNGRKFVVSYYGGSSYSNNISLTNNERIKGKNLGINQGIKFRVDLEDIIDTELNTSYSHNNATFSAGAIDDRQSSQINVKLGGRNYFFKDFTLGYDLTKTFNKGYNSSIGDPTFLSVYVEHRFLKNNRGVLRLQGFDLFGQNTGIQRDIFDNEIIDRQSNRLSTYFLLSFNYRLQHFGGRR